MSDATPDQGSAELSPSHKQMMAGYAVACHFGVLEARAFDLAEQMFAAFATATQGAPRVDLHAAILNLRAAELHPLTVADHVAGFRRGFAAARHAAAELVATQGAPTPAQPADAVDQERERCALLCDDLANMMESGAGDPEPGGRLRQAARNIRDPKHEPMRLDSYRAAGIHPTPEQESPK